MRKNESRVLAYWPQLFIFNCLLVGLRPQDPLNFALFLPGFFTSPFFSKNFRPLYLWLGWSFFAALVSPAFPSSLFLFGQNSLLVCAGFIAGRYGQEERRWLTVFQFLGLLTIGLIFVQAVAAPPFPPGWVSPAERQVIPFRATGLWHNPNLTGLFLAFLLPLFVAAWEGARRVGKRLYATLSGLLWVLTVPALLFTYSRTAWAAALASLVYYWSNGKQIKLRRLALSILILLALFPSVASRLGEKPWQSGTIRYRWRIWQETGKLVQKYPVTGSGTSELLSYLRPLRADHAHNHYLQLAAEWGLPAVLLFSWLVIQIFKAPDLPNVPVVNRRLQRGMKAAVTSQLIAGLTESVWVVPFGAFLFWFAFAYVIAGQLPTGDRSPEQN